VPDCGLYLEAFERQNNLSWLPSVSNVPALFALRTALVHAQNVPRQAAVSVAAPASLVARATPATERRNLGKRVRKPGSYACFTGNTAFANNGRARRVKEAISLAGGSDTLPEIMHEGVSIGVCISYHGKELCFEGCIMAGSHIPLTSAEQVPCHAWCTLVYA
jgi:hypothetical protein